MVIISDDFLVIVKFFRVVVFGLGGFFVPSSSQLEEFLAVLDPLEGEPELWSGMGSTSFID